MAHSSGQRQPNGNPGERADWVRLSGWTYGLDHRKFAIGSAQELITSRRPLGSGFLGFVQEVSVRGGLRNIVQKTVYLSNEDRQLRRRLIEDEVRTLRQLEHDHVVLLLGSFEEVDQSGKGLYCSLMAPVGEQNLATFLRESDQRRAEHASWLRKWFSCLASALAYIHDQGVRHEDIKPQNTIHLRDRIFFTDFGPATMFSNRDVTSYSGPASAITRKYAAPEHLDGGSNSQARNRRGARSDVFSLGCVFSEMLVVISGYTMVQFDNYLRADHERPAPYSQNLRPMDEWFGSGGMGSHNCRIYSSIIRPMLATERIRRPKADRILEQLGMDPMRSILPCPCDHASPPAQQSSGPTETVATTSTQWQWSATHQQYYYTTTDSNGNSQYVFADQSQS